MLAFTLALLCASTSAPPVQRATPEDLAAVDRTVSGEHSVQEKQAFRVRFSNLGEVVFAPVKVGLECRYVLLRGGKLLAMLDPGNAGWMCGGADAVAFADLDHDGKEDILVIASYMPGAGRDISYFPVAEVWWNLGEGRFEVRDVSHDDRYRSTHVNTIAQLKAYVARHPSVRKHAQ